jgi:hypothetical protein
VQELLKLEVRLRIYKRLKIKDLEVIKLKYDKEPPPKHVMTNHLSSTLVVSGACYRGWLLSLLGKMGTEKFPGAQRGVSVGWNSSKWRPGERKQKLGFWSVFYEI